MKDRFRNNAKGAGWSWKVAVRSRFVNLNNQPIKPDNHQTNGK